MATYFTHRVKNRIDLRAGTYGPPAPYPFQRQGDLSRGGMGRVTPSRNPRFLEQRHGVTDFQQFRAGQSLPGYDPRKVNKALLRLGIRTILRANPYTRIANIAFDVAYEMNWDNPMAYLVPERAESWQVPPGWTCYSQRSEPLSAACGNAVHIRTYSAGCIHVPADPLGGWNPAHRAVKAGPILGGIYSCNRFKSSLYVVYPNQHQVGGRTIDDFKYIPARSAVAMPVPLAVPAPAVVSEQYTPGPRDGLRELTRPYQRPAIEVSVGGRGGRPGHAPPVDTMHNRLPPEYGVKEKKTNTAPGPAEKLIYGLYDKTTEAKDIVDILYKNLRKKCKGSVSMSDKAYCVYRNLDSLDMDQAVKDLIYNHFEDKAFGKFFSYGKKAPFGAQLPGGTQPHLNLSQRT